MVTQDAFNMSGSRNILERKVVLVRDKTLSKKQDGETANRRLVKALKAQESRNTQLMQMLGKEQKEGQDRLNQLSEDAALRYFFIYF